MKQLVLLTAALFFVFVSVYSQSEQERTQTVQGSVIDKDTKSPLIGATVQVLETSPPVGTATDLDGKFIIPKVPVGRRSFKISFIGYKDVYLENIDVYSGKQAILNVELEESTKTVDEVQIRAFTNKTESMNAMSTVSSRQFSVEESGRYAGSRNDVSRMASNFAGVATSNDARNDIIIRGNAPNGQLWRLEGLDIPDPNHFSGIATNGGAVSILNYNVTANSDFYTGAFPAEYANATSGVFDLQLRNGNDKKYEHMFQLGAQGTEFMTEGPISRKNSSSYLVNYRFSTTSILKKMGLDFGYDGEADYQDASFRVKLGDLTFFGIGGSSVYKLNAEDRSEENFDFVVAENSNQNYRTEMLATGMIYLFRPNTKSYIKTTLGYTLQREITDEDSISVENGSMIEYYRNRSSIGSVQLNTFYKYKLSARHKVKVGVHVDRKILVLDQKMYSSLSQQLETYRDGRENTFLSNAYAQWAYVPNDNLTFTTGLTGMYFALNDTKSVEPRIGVKWKFTPKQYLSLGYGLHSQIQQIDWYFNTIKVGNDLNQTNENLDFNKSHHLVAGYGNKISNNLAFKSEVYYQSLFDIPVDRYPTSFSAINTGQEFELLRYDSLVNDGIGRNYGVELTLERFMNRGMYFLITTSLFNSEYQGSDGVWRDTRYNGKYVFNVLAGKEFKLNEYSKIIVDLKFTTAGGQRYTPIDVEASKLADRAVRDEEKAFTRQLNDYYRTDLKIAYRANGEKVSHEFFINIDNLLDNKNVFMQVYDRRSNSLQTVNQLGFFPTFQYKIMF